MKAKIVYSEVRLYNVIEGNIAKSECVEFVYKSKINGLANLVTNQSNVSRSKLNDGKIVYTPDNIHDFFKALATTDLTVDDTERKPKVFLCGKSVPIIVNSTEYETSYSKYFKINFVDLANYLINHYELNNNEIPEFYDTFNYICAPAIKQNTKAEVTL